MTAPYHDVRQRALRRQIIRAIRRAAANSQIAQRGRTGTCSLREVSGAVMTACRLPADWVGLVDEACLDMATRWGR